MDAFSRLTIAEQGVIGPEPAALPQHAANFAVEPRPVGNVHRHMLQQHGVEMAAIERKLERAVGLERHSRGLPGALGQITRGVHEGRADVDAGHLTAAARGEKSRRSADAAADV
jgi:hypothetical protein